jgi:hypothetical protein
VIRQGPFFACARWIAAGGAHVPKAALQVCLPLVAAALPPPQALRSGFWLLPGGRELAVMAFRI